MLNRNRCVNELLFWVLFILFLIIFIIIIFALRMSEYHQNDKIYMDTILLYETIVNINT